VKRAALGICICITWCGGAVAAALRVSSSSRRLTLALSAPKSASRFAQQRRDLVLPQRLTDWARHVALPSAAE